MRHRFLRILGRCNLGEFPPANLTFPNSWGYLKTRSVRFLPIEVVIGWWVRVRWLPFLIDPSLSVLNERPNESTKPNFVLLFSLPNHLLQSISFRNDLDVVDSKWKELEPLKANQNPNKGTSNLDCFGNWRLLWHNGPKALACSQNLSRRVFGACWGKCLANEFPSNFLPLANQKQEARTCRKGNRVEAAL